jgi:hypothetical protein
MHAFLSETSNYFLFHLTKTLTIAINEIGNKSDEITWYQQDVCAYHPHLSRPCNFSTRKMVRKWQTRLSCSYLQEATWLARDLRPLPSHDPGGSEFYPSCTRSSSAIPKRGSSPKPSPSQVHTTTVQRPGKLRSEHIHPWISLHSRSAHVKP